MLMIKSANNRKI